MADVLALIQRKQGNLAGVKMIQRYRLWAGSDMRPDDAGYWYAYKDVDEEIKHLRAALSSIAEVIPEYASEAWMVQAAKDALAGVKNDDR